MTKEKIKVHDTFPMEDLERLKKAQALAEATEYECTLDTLVEWFGGQVPDSTYKKLREGTHEVLEWIKCEKKKFNESSSDS